MAHPESSRIPWLRLLVEGVLIVLSILLAFGIEAWWDGLQDQERSRQYAAGLLEDAHINLLRLRESQREAESILGAAVELSERLKGGAVSADADSVQKLLVSSFAVARFRPVRQGYDQVVSAGDLGLLSEELRSAIADWNESWTLYQNTETQSQEDRHQTYVPFLVDETSLRRAFSLYLPDAPFGESAFPPAVTDLVGNRRLDNLITYRILFGHDQLIQYENMQRVLADLIAVLE